MGEGKVFGGNLCFTTGALLGRQDCGIFVFLPCPPLPFCPFFGSDLEMSHHPLAIQWPPMSVGTLLTDSPAQGWAQERAGLPTSQSNAVPPRLFPYPRPCQGFPPSNMAAFPVATEELPFWICHPRRGG